MERHRIGGVTKILPDAETKAAMTRAGQKRIITTIRYCNSVKGVMDFAEVIESSGYPSYDEVIRSTMLETWRYRPFLVDGAAVRVCTSQTFIYNASPMAVDWASHEGGGSKESPPLKAKRRPEQ